MITNEIVLKQEKQITEVISAIDNGIVKACDGFMVTEPKVSIIKHYFTYAFEDELGVKWFFITMASIGKVSLMNQNDLAVLAVKYNFTLKEHIRFVGDDSERTQAIRRGLNVIGKPYKWVFANCENLMNYIQTGKSKSKQTRIASVGLATIGGAMTLSKNKGVKNIGLAMLVIGLIVNILEYIGEDKF